MKPIFIIHLKLKLNHLTHTVINHSYWCITYKCVALVRFNIRNPDKISQFLFTRLILVYLIILIDGSMDCHLFSKLCWCRNLFLYIFRENHIIRFGLPIKLVMYFGTRDYICAGMVWKKTILLNMNWRTMPIQKKMYPYKRTNCLVVLRK